MKPLAAIALLIVIVALVPDALFAQPPGMPGAPEQAPIDGGLGLLAAGGAAYAWKRLKGKKS